MALALCNAWGIAGMGSAQAQVHAACEQTKLISPTPAAGDKFGTTAIHGDFVLVGAPQQATSPGEAHVFVRSSGRWEHEARLVPGDGTQGDGLGFSVALGDNLAVIGSPRNDTVSDNTGAVYVFERLGGKWHRQARLVASDGAPYDYFGFSVAIYDSWIVATTLPNPGGGNLSGAAYVFFRNGSMWQEVVKLRPLQGRAKDEFGCSCAIDSDVIVVGAPSDSTSVPGAGAVYVFERTGGTWIQKAKLIPMFAAFDGGFGTRVAVNSNTLFGTAPGSATKQGAAYVFDKNGGVWTETIKLTASDGGPFDFFGSSVALEKNVAVIGASFDDELGLPVGAAYVFKKTGMVTWTEEKILPHDPSPEQLFGMSASIDGGTAVIGSWDDASIAQRAGSAYVFLVDQVLTTYCTAKVNSLNCLPSIAFTGCPSATTASGFEIRGSEVRNNKLGVLLYSITGRNVLPFSGGTLCVELPVRRTPAVDSGGAPVPTKDCSGVFRLDMSAFASGTLGRVPIPELRVPGTVVNCQWWGRDLGATFATTLSNALEYVIGP
jgi:hypothetical protein